MRIKNSGDVENALNEKGLKWDSKNGHNSHELKDGSGRIMWDDDQEFSEPMSNYFTGVLKCFGIIAAFVALFVTAFYMIS